MTDENINDEEPEPILSVKVTNPPKSEDKEEFPTEEMTFPAYITEAEIKEFEEQDA